MREIKFRAWDKKDKEMLSWGDLNELCYEIGHLKLFVLMLSLGIKDKNGVEIYEGDILEYESIKRGKMPAKVIWYKGDLAYLMESVLGSYMTLPRKREDREVIGNIYENPALFINKK